ncbi:MAG: hypothetical protein ABIH03_08745 [Pseudomonadota bacterium]
MRLDEIEGPPKFTTEEKERLRKYKPPGNLKLTPWYRKRPGQSGEDAAAERREWFDSWYHRLHSLERQW